MHKKTKTILKSLFILAVFALAINTFASWTAPTLSAPNGNIPPPVNTGTDPQMKSGAFAAGGLRSFGIGLFDGQVGIGTTSPGVPIVPTQPLDVIGNVKFSGDLMLGRALIVNGSAGAANQVLTSAGPNNSPTWGAGGSGSVVWGAITGTLSNQIDLQNALNLKAPILNPIFTGIVTLPGVATPVLDSFADIAGDNNLWGTNRGGLIFHDGTSSTSLVNVLTSDTPANGQVPKWNTNGTITWEDVGSGLMINPMTTHGDIIYGGSSPAGVPTRLGAGTAGKVLTSNGPGTAPSWQNSSGAGFEVFVDIVDCNVQLSTGTMNGSGGIYKHFFVVPPSMNGWKLVGYSAAVCNGSGNTMDIIPQRKKSSDGTSTDLTTITVNAWNSPGEWTGNLTVNTGDRINVRTWAGSVPNFLGFSMVYHFSP